MPDDNLGQPAGTGSVVPGMAAPIAPPAAGETHHTSSSGAIGLSEGLPGAEGTRIWYPSGWGIGQLEPYSNNREQEETPNAPIFRHADWHPTSIAGGAGPGAGNIMYGTPQHTFDASQQSVWTAVNHPTNTFHFHLGFWAKLTGDVVAMIAAGTPITGQFPMRSRSGFAVDDGAQHHYGAWFAYVWRPDAPPPPAITTYQTGTVVADLMPGVVRATSVRTDGFSRENRAWNGMLTAFPGIQSGDWIVVEIGNEHIAPTISGAGCKIHVYDSFTEDLPEGNSNVVVDPATLNTWLRVGPTGEPEAVPLNWLQGSGAWPISSGE